MTDILNPQQLMGRLSESPPTSLPHLIGRLESVQDALPAAGLSHVVPFAASYLVLTQLASSGIQNESFKDPVTTSRIACTFANWYFSPLSSHLQGEDAPIPTPWQQLLHSPTALQGPSWLRLALGLNAHINHDLALALHYAETPVAYREDFFSVNAIIKASAPKLSTDYLPRLPHPVASGITTASVRTICSWRRQAWNTFECLQSGTPVQEVQAKLAYRSTEIGKRLLHAGRIALLA